MIIQPSASFYSRQQLDLYLTAIGYPQAAKVELGDDASPLDRLRLLVRLHIVAFPWSNTEMHYKRDHHVDVSTEGVFNLLIHDKTKATYCFGHNTLFLGMLKCLGYRVYLGSARTVIGVPLESQPTRLTHMVLFVQPFSIDGPRAEETYVVDVGLGSSSVCEPILLSDDPGNTVKGTTMTEKHRIQRRVIPGSVIPSKPMWELQLWRSGSGEKANGIVDSNAPIPEQDEWTGIYVFSEEEVFLCDIWAASFFVCNIPNQVGRMQNNILITRSYFLDPTKPKIGGDIGKYILFDDTLKKTEGNKSEVVKVFKSERDRIECIRKVFGIVLDDDAEEVIRDRTPALKLAST